MVDSNVDRLVWIDIETFGLNPTDDPILEVGFKITDPDLNVIDDFQVVTWETPWYDARFSQMQAVASEGGDSYVLDMHQNSELWDDCLAKGITQPDAESAALDWLNGHGVNKGDPVCGSSLRFDRDMLRTWMPAIDNLFSYRIIDVSSIKETCMRLNPTVYARLDAETKPVKAHRVLSDITDTIGEFDFYIKNFLVTQQSV